ncbi:hypothetical protein TRSC58_07545 [Trypanosoma rangeli SC58]|uniref:Uncharacterized protein n=1 Tax=Trypanosoma rangeli SC58 TaxID=429131 RepID=A0A061IRV5_TRYRA|nr:hypothetical protein TRSC58_07545 [Trypanosoma rangeli SC58]
MDHISSVVLARMYVCMPLLHHSLTVCMWLCGRGPDPPHPSPHNHDFLPGSTALWPIPPRPFFPPFLLLSSSSPLP